jgi:hypothetical protein
MRGYDIPAVVVVNWPARRPFALHKPVPPVARTSSHMYMRLERVILALSVLAPGCQGAPAAGPVSAGSLELNVMLSYTGIYPGQQTLIVMTLINRSTRPLTLRYDTSFHVVYFIESPEGNIVVPNTGIWACSPSVSQMQLAAHQATVNSAPFTGESIGADGAPVPFPPGVYSVYATYAPNPEIRSEAVALTVYPAP